QNPQANRGCAVVCRGRNPARPQNRGDVEQQNVPEAHLPPQLLFRIAGFGDSQAHKVTSSAGINSSCCRKLWRKGSFELSKSDHESNTLDVPSCKNTIWSASFFAKWVSWVTTIDVLWKVSFSRAIRSPMCVAMMGSTIVVGSSNKIASGFCASALAIATAR